MHPFLEDFKFAAFAHRGGALEAAENTLEAFEHAIQLGFKYIETDVQRTSDGVVVIFHDDELDRLTEATGRIADHPWSEIKALHVRNGGTIPRLEDALKAWPHIKFNIDAKTEDVAAPLCQIARADNLERLCLASESDKRIAFIREELGPAVCTVGATWETTRFVLPMRLGLPSWPTSADCLQVPLRAYGISLVTERTLQRTRDAGKALHVWTIDDESEMGRLVQMGVGGIMTDRPSVLKSVLKSHNSWD